MASPSVLPHPFVRPVREGMAPLISPGGLAELLAGDAPPILVDVRPGRERLWAKFHGDIHIPLSELPKRFSELTPGRPIVAYDQFGADARRAAEFLQVHGQPFAAALEGGLDEYARLVDPTVPRYRPGARTGEFLLCQLPRPDTGCLSYLLADAVEKKALVIDPGRSVDPYLAALHEANLDLVAVVETHTHADHLAGHSALHSRTDAPIYVSHQSPAQYPHQSLAEGDSLGFGSQELTVMETPGHTRDHLTLRVGDRIFTGDTLLIGGCGRTDLGDGSPEMLWESLTEKLLRLPDETEVFPAHFGRRHALIERYASTIGFERGTNEALGQGNFEAFVKYMTEGWPPKPDDFDRIVRTNLEG
ncbi:MAG: MBL fold metallo-hydrolase [Thermoplasmata archaeon]